MIEDYESINEMTDAQAAEVLENMRIRIDGGRGNGKTKLFYSYNVAMQKAIQKLKAGWIPVSERLPEDMQRVLIWFEYYRYGDFNCMYQTYGFGYVCDGKWSPFINGETGWQDYRIIAWQLLPEPYREGGAEE